MLYDNPYGSVNQSVLKFQSNGLPAVVQLAPCYRDSQGRFESTTDNTKYGYEVGNDHNCLGLEIVFPGQPGYVAPVGTAEDVIGEFYIISSDYWGSYENTATTLVISASDDNEKGNVMITEFQGVSATTNDTFNPLYGTYENGVLSFGITQEKDGMFVDGNGSTHRFRNYFDKDLEFTVPRKGVLTIGYFKSYIGNRWDKDENGSFDQLWIQYDAFAQ